MAKGAVPAVINPKARQADKAAKTKTRVRRSVAERRRELEEKLAKVREQEARMSVVEALKAGRVSDPKRAKELQQRIAAFSTGAKHYVAAGLVKQEQCDALAISAQKELEALIVPEAA